MQFRLELEKNGHIKSINLKLVIYSNTIYHPRHILVSSQFLQKTFYQLVMCWVQDISRLANSLMFKVYQRVRVLLVQLSVGISHHKTTHMVTLKLIDFLVQLVNVNSQVKFGKARKWRVGLVTKMQLF